MLDLLKSAKESMDAESYAEAIASFMSAACGADGELAAEVYFQAGVCHYQLKQYKEAEKNLETALDILKDRDYNDTKHIYDLLRMVYRKSFDFKRLAEICRKAPLCDEQIIGDLKLAYQKTGRWTELLELLEREEPENLFGKMQCLKFLNRVALCLSAADAYIKTFGEDRHVCVLLMELYYNALQPEKGFEYFKKAIEKSDSPAQRLEISRVFLGKDIYHDAADGDVFLRIIEDMRRDSETLEERRDFKNAKKPFKKLRLGYISADFRAHPGGYFLLPVMLNTVDSHSFIKCYSLTSPEQGGDLVMEKMKQNADEWADIYGQSDAYIEEMVLDDGMDVVFDLLGHTENNRMPLFIRRIAPVQISWICFPVTAGVTGMDYILTDRYSDPPGKCEKYYVEKPLYMPKTYLCYTLSGAPQAKPPAFERNGYITFACFHNTAKLTDKTLRLWRRILEGAEGSVLKVMGHIPEGFHEGLTERFRRSGIPMERVSISPMCGLNEYFASYNEVDIMLDTYPFNGATTTFDAFKMGRPIISLAGERHVSRVGYSMLENVGLGELAAFTEDEYVEKAVGLAKSPERLRRIINELPKRVKSSALVNQAGFREDFEKTIRDAWSEHCLLERTAPYDYAADSLNELLEQTLNATVYFGRKLDNMEKIDEALMSEYHSLQSALLTKLRLRIDDAEFIKDYERFVSFLARRLDASQLRALLDLAMRYLAML